MHDVIIDNSSFRRPIFENPLRSYVQKSPSLFQQIAHRNFSNQINKPYDMDKKNWISDADNCNNEQNSDATKNHHASEVLIYIIILIWRFNFDKYNY